MGTALGLGFIVAAAATGIFVGTRPTVMDGRWIAEQLTQSASESDDGEARSERAELVCDREIPVGVRGAEFACVASTGARFRFRMSRDGKLEQIGVEQVRRGRAGRSGGGAASAGAAERRDEPARGRGAEGSPEEQGEGRGAMDEDRPPQ